LLHCVGDALQVLDVDGGDHVDSGVEITMAASTATPCRVRPTIFPNV
jgi:hypothetical protein